MHPSYEQTERSASYNQPSTPDTRLYGRWLAQARLVSITVFALALALLLVCVPLYFASLHMLCTGTATACNATGQLAPGDVRRLQQLGLSIDFFGTYLIVIALIFALGYWLVAALLFWRKSDNPLALLAAVALGTFPLAFNSSSISSLLPSPWSLLIHCISFLGDLCIILFFYVFPSGHFVPRWTRWVLIPTLVYWGFNEFFPQAPFNPFFRFLVLNVVTFLGVVGGMVVVQVYRYRRVSTPTQRQQTKWVVYGVTMGVGGFLLLILLSYFFSSLFTTGSLAFLIVNAAIYGLMLLLPLSIGFAILRYRLWDIDRLINLTLVYGLLTGALVFIYIVLVIALQYLLRGIINQTSDLAIVGSTLVIAALFQPLRRRLQRIINRLMYGERDDPYAALTRLGKRLEATLAADTVLPTIVETVAQTLKLAYVAITLATDERQPHPGEVSPSEDSFITVATYGSPTAHPLRLPLIYQAETSGYLLIGPRPGETLTSANQRLLTDLARQIGISAHSVQLTTELQQARESLVLAREEERRRLRRDLHDGLGPQLASQALTLTAARKLLRDDPDAADELLADATIHAQEAITDIRRLVYALRPPALDDLGLVAALREQATQYGSSGVAITLDAPEQLPPLPAAVEVACYRIVQEALTNVVRHAHAHCCTIRLFVNESLCLEVTDDGDSLPTAYRAGVGLTSMRERAKELGGTCVIDRATGGGACVYAQLPLL